MDKLEAYVRHIESLIHDPRVSRETIHNEMVAFRDNNCSYCGENLPQAAIGGFKVYGFSRYFCNDSCWCEWLISTGEVIWEKGVNCGE